MAVFHDEPAARQLHQTLTQASRKKLVLLLSEINFGECLYISEREASHEHAVAVADQIEQLPIRIVPADRKLVVDAAHLKANFRISFADAFAAALAIRHDAPIVTGDPEFLALEKLLKIEWLGE